MAWSSSPLQVAFEAADDRPQARGHERVATHRELRREGRREVRGAAGGVVQAAGEPPGANQGRKKEQMFRNSAFPEAHLVLNRANLVVWVLGPGLG